MKNHDKMSPEEVDELKKSLTDLGMSEEEVGKMIEKAMKEDEGEEKESGKEETMEEKAEKEGVKEEKKEVDEHEEDEEEMEKSMSDDELIEKCSKLEMKKGMIEKSISRIKARLGKTEDIHKSIDEDIIKSISDSIDSKIDTKFEDIQKSLLDSIDLDKIKSDIEKSMKDELEDIRKDVKKIGDTPIGRKAVLTSVNFFEKGNFDDLNDENKESKELSFSKDKDEIIKGLEDLLSESKDNDEKEILQNGICDITVNKTPTEQGTRALSILLRKKNITFVQ